MPKLKKILGRWLESSGIGILTGAVLTYRINDVLYWYFLVGGLAFTIFGTYMSEKYK